MPSSIYLRKKKQTHKASNPALLFLEDAQANYVGSFFRDDSFVFPDDNPLCFMRQIAIPNHRGVGACAGLNSTYILFIAFRWNFEKK